MCKPTVSTAGPTALTITWQKPDPPHGIITEYTIDYGKNPEMTPNISKIFPIRSNNQSQNEYKASLEKLTNNTMYFLKVCITAQ